MLNGSDYWEIYKSIATQKVGLDLDYGVTTIDGMVYLCLDGSNSASDWFHDFMFPRKVYKKQRAPMIMHSGFSRIWKSGNDVVIQDLITECEKQNCTEPTIVGHSLGGALALFAAEDFEYRTGRSVHVVTFGAPKACGSKKSAKIVRRCCLSIHEYEQRNDFVPHCPPLPFYCHVGPEKIGPRFSLLKFFHFNKWHHEYGNPEDYKRL